MRHQQAKLEWTDDVPVSQVFDDPYYSLENGLAETRHVFIAGNDLERRLTPGFHVAELGFGTGLNLLALMNVVRDLGTGQIRYTGFEAYPMTPDDMARALALFPEMAEDAARLVELWADGPAFETPEIRVEVILGDARETQAQWGGSADAWFLDGFSPAKNPELWEPYLLEEVGKHSAPGGTAATYSAAGHVRRALEAAGFAVERRPGYGRKRHMTVARRP